MMKALYAFIIALPELMKMWRAIVSEVKEGKRIENFKKTEKGIDVAFKKKDVRAASSYLDG